MPAAVARASCADSDGPRRAALGRALRHLLRAKAVLCPGLTVSLSIGGPVVARGQLDVPAGGKQVKRFLATLPAGEDPDTLVRRQGAAGFQAVLEAARPVAEAGRRR